MVCLGILILDTNIYIKGCLKKLGFHHQEKLMGSLKMALAIDRLRTWPKRQNIILTRIQGIYWFFLKKFVFLSLKNIFNFLYTWICVRMHVHVYVCCTSTCY